MTVAERAGVGELLQRTWMFSSDSHVIEPPDLWSGRLPKHLAERGPRVVAEEAGDFWYLDGHMLCSFAGVDVGERFEKSMDELHMAARFDEVPTGAYIPRRYLEDNERDGVWGTVIYPTMGLVLFNVPLTELISATMKAYNDWLGEFCSEDPARLKGVAMVNLDNIEDAVGELERCRTIGLSGAMITCAPPSWAPLHSEVYDPFWAAAQDLDMPLSMHCATERPDPRVGWDAWVLPERASDPNWLMNRDATMRAALADMILSGVFERFPRLKLGSVENELGWIPFFLNQIDFQYTQRANRFGDRFRIKDRDAIPSQFWRSNCFASFQEDSTGMRLRDLIGVDTLVWGSDYPHVESTFPRSRQILEGVFSDVPPDEVRMIIAQNSMRLYGFEAPAAPPS